MPAETRPTNVGWTEIPSAESGLALPLNIGEIRECPETFPPEIFDVFIKDGQPQPNGEMDSQYRVVPHQEEMPIDGMRNPNALDLVRIDSAIFRDHEMRYICRATDPTPPPFELPEDSKEHPEIYFPLYSARFIVAQSLDALRFPGCSPLGNPYANKIPTSTPLTQAEARFFESLFNPTDYNVGVACRSQPVDGVQSYWVTVMDEILDPVVARLNAALAKPNELPDYLGATVAERRRHAENVRKFIQHAKDWQPPTPEQSWMDRNYIWILLGVFGIPTLGLLGAWGLKLWKKIRGGSAKTANFRREIERKVINDPDYYIRGRTEEARELLRQLDTPRERGYHNVFIYGPSGEGKTLLQEEVIRLIVTSDLSTPEHFRNAPIRYVAPLKAQADEKVGIRGGLSNNVIDIFSPAENGPIIFVVEEADNFFMFGGSTSGEEEQVAKTLLEFIDKNRANIMIVANASRPENMRRASGFARRFVWHQLRILPTDQIVNIFFEENKAKRSFEQRFNVRITRSSTEMAAYLVERFYITQLRDEHIRAGQTADIPSPRFDALENVMGNASRIARNEAQAAGNGSAQEAARTANTAPDAWSNFWNDVAGTTGSDRIKAIAQELRDHRMEMPAPPEAQNGRIPARLSRNPFVRFFARIGGWFARHVPFRRSRPATPPSGEPVEVKFRHVLLALQQECQRTFAPEEIRDALVAMERGDPPDVRAAQGPGGPAGAAPEGQVGRSPIETGLRSPDGEVLKPARVSDRPLLAAELIDSLRSMSNPNPDPNAITRQEIIDTAAIFLDRRYGMDRATPEAQRQAAEIADYVEAYKRAHPGSNPSITRQDVRAALSEFARTRPELINEIVYNWATKVLTGSIVTETVNSQVRSVDAAQDIFRAITKQMQAGKGGAALTASELSEARSLSSFIVDHKKSHPGSDPQRLTAQDLFDGIRAYYDSSPSTGLRSAAPIQPIPGAVTGAEFLNTYNLRRIIESYAHTNHMDPGSPKTAGSVIATLRLARYKLAHPGPVTDADIRAVMSQLSSEQGPFINGARDESLTADERARVAQIDSEITSQTNRIAAEIEARLQAYKAANPGPLTDADVRAVMAQIARDQRPIGGDSSGTPPEAPSGGETPPTGAAPASDSSGDGDTSEEPSAASGGKTLNYDIGWDPTFASYPTDVYPVYTPDIEEYTAEYPNGLPISVSYPLTDPYAGVYASEPAYAYATASAGYETRAPDITRGVEGVSLRTAGSADFYPGGDYGYSTPEGPRNTDGTSVEAGNPSAATPASFLAMFGLDLVLRAFGIDPNAVTGNLEFAFGHYVATAVASGKSLAEVIVNPQVARDFGVTGGAFTAVAQYIVNPLTAGFVKPTTPMQTAVYSALHMGTAIATYSAAETMGSAIASTLEGSGMTRAATILRFLGGRVIPVIGWALVIKDAVKILPRFLNWVEAGITELFGGSMTQADKNLMLVEQATGGAYKTYPQVRTIIDAYNRGDNFTCGMNGVSIEAIDQAIEDLDNVTIAQAMTKRAELEQMLFNAAALELNSRLQGYDGSADPSSVAVDSYDIRRIVEARIAGVFGSSDYPTAPLLPTPPGLAHSDETAYPEECDAGCMGGDMPTTPPTEEEKRAALEQLKLDDPDLYAELMNEYGDAYSAYVHEKSNFDKIAAIFVRNSLDDEDFANMVSALPEREEFDRAFNSQLNTWFMAKLAEAETPYGNPLPGNFADLQAAIELQDASAAANLLMSDVVGEYSFGNFYNQLAERASHQMALKRMAYLMDHADENGIVDDAIEISPFDGIYGKELLENLGDGRYQINFDSPYYQILEAALRDLGQDQCLAGAPNSSGA